MCCVESITILNIVEYIVCVWHCSAIFFLAIFISFYFISSCHRPLESHCLRKTKNRASFPIFMRDTIARDIDIATHITSIENTHWMTALQYGSHTRSVCLDGVVRRNRLRTRSWVDNSYCLCAIHLYLSLLQRCIRFPIYIFLCSRHRCRLHGCVPTMIHFADTEDERRGKKILRMTKRRGKSEMYRYVFCALMRGEACACVGRLQPSTQWRYIFSLLLLSTVARTASALLLRSPHHRIGIWGTVTTITYQRDGTIHHQQRK